MKPPWIPWCRRNPQRWDTEHLVDGTYRRAPKSGVEAAVRACRSCPLLEACRSLTPEPNTVLAGVIYGPGRRPYRSVHTWFDDTPEVQLDLCGRAVGTTWGYRIHRDNGEKPCGPCREVRNAEKRAAQQRRSPRKRNRDHKRSTCGRGHPFTDATTRRGPTGRRVCGVCRPSRDVTITPDAGRPTTCRSAGHDLTKPGHVTIDAHGSYVCVPCRREREARRKETLRAAAAAAKRLSELAA